VLAARAGLVRGWGRLECSAAECKQVGCCSLSIFCGVGGYSSQQDEAKVRGFPGSVGWNPGMKILSKTQSWTRASRAAVTDNLLVIPVRSGAKILESRYEDTIEDSVLDESVTRCSDGTCGRHSST
jgi:hypothetical protein